MKTPLAPALTPKATASNLGTFGRTGTGRLQKTDPYGLNNVTPKRGPSNLRTPKSNPSKAYQFNAPNLRTAARRRTSALSDNSDIANRVDTLFKDKIEYKALAGNALDERLAELIEEYKIRMPIKIIESGKHLNKYLMGTKIVHANLDARNVMVRVGGGYREFREYLKCEEVELRRLQLKVDQSG